jgi:glycosyltransferase involved in cell wall biosynthesis
LKVLIVSPHYPPYKGGVSDHVWQQSKRLAELGHEITVWCQGPGETPHQNILRQDIPWPFNPQSVSEKLVGLSFDAIIVHFTPLSFSPKKWGINLLLFRAIQTLKTYCDNHLSLMVHEANYPFNLTLRGLVLGPLHLFQFFVLVNFCPIVLLSHQALLDRWRRLLPWSRKKFHLLPVGSNFEISNYHLASREELAKRYNLPIDAYWMLYFGGSHQSILFDFIIEALKRVDYGLKEKKAILITIGDNQSCFERLSPALKDNYFPLGRLEAEELCGLVSKAELCLVPYIDGVSTRRGSIMVPFSLGTPLLTTTSYGTKKDVPWHKICALTPAYSISNFADRALELAQSPEQAKKLGAEGKDYFENHLAAKPLTAKLTGYLFSNLDG